MGINIFTRIPLRASALFVGSLVFGVRKFDLVEGGRVFPPYAAYHNWGNIPGFTIVPSKTEVLVPWSRLVLQQNRRDCIEQPLHNQLGARKYCRAP